MNRKLNEAIEIRFGSESPDGSTDRQRVFYDVGFMLHLGFKSPHPIAHRLRSLGLRTITRLVQRRRNGPTSSADHRRDEVGQYLAEFLVGQPLINLQFVLFDRKLSSYRILKPSERRVLDHILSRGPPSDPHCRGLLPDSQMQDLQSVMPRKQASKLAGVVHQMTSRLAKAARGRGAGRPTKPHSWIRPYPLGRGDVLIIDANAWVYMDYAYLTHIVRRDGVRLIATIPDVIAMELPFAAPAPMHLYHRHWVELGHLATHLVAYSSHGLRSYRRFIGDPNDLDPRMSYAHPPNLLHDRQDEIGEAAITELLGRSFVMFSGTIAAGKNHQLLLHLWERLRQEIGADVLPILVFVGGWGWGAEEVRSMSERNWRLRDHLRIFADTTDAELIWLYRHARFTVCPAFAEGFGLAAAESLSFGTPVVISNCPALVEATEGLMPCHDPLDFPSWLTEMRRLILDDDYVASLRTQAAGFDGVGHADFGVAILDATLAERESIAR